MPNLREYMEEENKKNMSNTENLADGVDEATEGDVPTISTEEVTEEVAEEAEKDTEEVKPKEEDEVMGGPGVALGGDAVMESVWWYTIVLFSSTKVP